jgi:hypothetical protein
MSFRRATRRSLRSAARASLRAFFGIPLRLKVIFAPIACKLLSREAFPQRGENEGSDTNEAEADPLIRPDIDGG